MMMNIEAKICLTVGSILIFSYTIIAYVLHTSWVSVGYSVDWWTTIVPWLAFTIATILMLVIAYETSVNPVSR